jgi:hypothetical protein
MTKGSPVDSGPTSAPPSSRLGTTGAIVVGRRLYDLTGGWEGTHPLGDGPFFLVTHSRPDSVPCGPTSFTFVEGVQAAVEQPCTRQATKMYRSSAGRASRVSVWPPGCSTRSRSTWQPSYSAKASVCSTIQTGTRSNWSRCACLRLLAFRTCDTAFSDNAREGHHGQRPTPLLER